MIFTVRFMVSGRKKKSWYCSFGVDQNYGSLMEMLKLTPQASQVYRVFWEVLWVGGRGAVRGLLGERDSSVQEKLWNVAGLWRET